MNSLSAIIVKGAVRLYTYPYRKNHRSLSRSVKIKDHPYHPPKNWEHRITHFDWGTLEILSPPRPENNLSILFFHGGGHTMTLNRYYRKIIERYARISNMRVYSIDYTADKNMRHPALLNVCYRCCMELEKQGFDLNDFIAVGDSMGANLMLACALKLRDENKPLFRAMISVSVGSDFSLSGDSYRTNCHLDPMYGLPKKQSFEKNEGGLRRKNPYAEGCELTDPYLSPAFADLSSFPKMLLQCGGYETSLSDTLMVYENAQKANVSVTLSEYDGMFHDFQYLFPFLKESKKAWKEIAAFIEQVQTCKLNNKK